MSTPVVEQIAVKVKTRLEAITTSGGYQTTVSSVVRPTRIDETQIQDYQIYVTQETPTKNESLSCSGNPQKIAWDQPFRLRSGLRPSESSTTALDTLRNTFNADTQKALAQAESGHWSQWDGLALESNLGSAEWFIDDDGSQGGLTVMLVVTYRTPEDNPYTVG